MRRQNNWARDLAKNAPPDPIPNSEVKVFGADDTLYGESRFCGPFFIYLFIRNQFVIC